MDFNKLIDRMNYLFWNIIVKYTLILLAFVIGWITAEHIYEKYL